MSAPLRLPSRLMVIADASHGPDPASRALRAASAGAPLIELRRPRRAGERALPASALLAEVRAVVEGGDAEVLVNDRVDLAAVAGAAGAHVGQDDLPAAAARALLGPGSLLGLSTHDEAQLEAAQDEPLDYVAVGPIFRSPTKSGHAPEVGLAALAAWRRSSRLPVVAIGGITSENAPDVLAAGADVVALGSAVAGSGDDGSVEEAVARALEAVGAPAPLRGGAPVLLAGFPGSGKSTVGRHLARLLGGRFLDLDEELEPGVPAAEVHRRLGEREFRRRERSALGRVLRQATGGPAVVVALGGGFLDAPASARLAGANGRLAWLEADLDTCMDRAGAEGLGRPVLQAVLRAEGRAGVARLHADRTRRGRIASIRVDAAGPPAAVARELAARLAR